MTEVTPQAALATFADGDLARWSGLPRTTSLNDVSRVADVDLTWRAAARLGEARRQAEWTSATFSHWARGVRVWVAHGTDAVLLMDTEFPDPRDDLAQLLDRFGPAELILDSYLGTFRIPGSELAYPSRGITLYHNPETGGLLRVAVYSPTDSGGYRRELRLDLQMHRRRPQPRPEVE